MVFYSVILSFVIVILSAFIDLLYYQVVCTVFDRSIGQPADMNNPPSVGKFSFHDVRYFFFY